MMNVLSLAGPGLKHDIQRALNVRNLKRKTALTAGAGRLSRSPGLLRAQAAPARHGRAGDRSGDDHPDRHRHLSVAAERGRRQGDVQGLQRMGLRVLPGESRSGCSSPRCCRCRIPSSRQQEVYRVAAKGCRVGLVRPIDAMGNYPIQPKYEPVWNAMEETGMVYGMHPFPAFGALKPPGYTEQYSGAELIALSASTAGLPHSFLTNVQNFQAEASLWVTMVLMSGFFERHPKAQGGGVRGILDLAQLPARRMRQGATGSIATSASCRRSSVCRARPSSSIA